VPPLNGVAVEIVDDWPESIVVVPSEIRGEVRASLTVTVMPPEIRGEPELSVTWSLKDQVPTVFNVPVRVETEEIHDEEPLRLLKLLAPGAFCNHKQV